MWELPLLSSGNPENELTAEQDGATIRRSILPGGVRVVTEHMPGQRSATVGAWVGVGSRDETDGHFGSTHFLEHLLFKGTARRSAMDIAQAFDAVGGEANAATGKESTCYYARVLDSDLPMAVDVITDMITSARIDHGELETERGVILEELAMTEDDPGDLVHEEFSAVVLAGHDLGRPIGGTAQTITDVPRSAVWSHYQEHYRPETLVVTGAGSINHEELCNQVSNALVSGGWELDPGRTPRPRRDTSEIVGLGTASREVVINRPVEQANIIIGSTGLSATDPRRFQLSVLSAILGGGMSSRMFQEIRERRGLAYSTYCFGSSHVGVGTFGLYAGCAPSRVDEVANLMVTELEKLCESGITEDELTRTKGQLRGGLVLGLEDSGSRMNRLGRSELVTGELLSLQESLDRIGFVTAQEVQELAIDLASRPRSQVRVGPFGG